jgi:hypothetical protein
MKAIKWYTDDYSERVVKEIQRQVGEQLSRMFPDFELTHIGVNKIEGASGMGEIREVQIKLHMRPYFEARAIHERLEAAKRPRLGA